MRKRTKIFKYWVCIILSLVLGAVPVLANTSPIDSDTQIQASVDSFIIEAARTESDLSAWENGTATIIAELGSESNNTITHLLFQIYDNNNYLGYLVYDCAQNFVCEFSSAPSPIMNFQDKYQSELLDITTYQYVYQPAYWIYKTPDCKTYFSRGGDVLKQDYQVTPRGTLTLVPRLQGCYLCIPTALAHVVWYWDGKAGFSNLVPSGMTFSTLQSTLQTLMAQQGSAQSNSNISPALYNYAFPKGFSRQVVRHSSPSFSTIVYEIDNKYPVLLGFSSANKIYGGAHMTCCLGYTVLNSVNYVVLADGHHDYQYRTAWSSYNDNIYTIRFTKN